LETLAKKEGGDVLIRSLLFGAVGCLVLASTVQAQDAVKADSTHYRVEVDNPQVRILRVHYGPHEKSVMHSHPATVAIFLTDGQGRFTFPDGKTQEFSVKAGDVQYSAAVVHTPENTGDQPLDLIVVELKGKAAAPAVPATKTGKK
jgi:quercetin dioxygenase-like cupin family protein